MGKKWLTLRVKATVVYATPIWFLLNLEGNMEEIENTFKRETVGIWSRCSTDTDHDLHHDLHHDTHRGDQILKL